MDPAAPAPQPSAILPGGRPREFGRDRGLFEVPEDFNDPLPDEVLDSFEK